MASRLLTRVAPSLIKRVGVRSNAHLAVMPEDSRDWGLVKTDKALIEQENHEYHHGIHTAKLWNMISLAGLGVFFVTAIHTYFYEAEHYSHPRDEFVPYPHTRLRICGGWPWAGDGSFFHDPRFNALKEGYEE